MRVQTVNIEGQSVGEAELSDDVFAATVSLAVLWEEVKAQRARRRRGTHSTKTRANVRGGGKKPHKQKGTGQARQGSSRAPNHVGGGIAFGPHPRSYWYRLPRTARRAALRSALSLKNQEQHIFVVEDLTLPAPKTKAVVELVQRLGLAKGALIIDIDNTNLQLATRNFAGSKCITPAGVNVYDILKHQNLVLARRAIASVEARARKSAAPLQEGAAP